MTPEEQADALRSLLDDLPSTVTGAGAQVLLRTTAAEQDDPVVAGAVRLISHFGLSADPVLSPEGALEVARVVLEGRPR